MLSQPIGRTNTEYLAKQSPSVLQLLGQKQPQARRGLTASRGQSRMPELASDSDIRLHLAVS
jgi:hypothetical protein